MIYYPIHTAPNYFFFYQSHKQDLEIKGTEMNKICMHIWTKKNLNYAKKNFNNAKKYIKYTKKIFKI